MSGVKRYILWQMVGPFVFATAALTGVAWLTQSLRFLDLIINRGLSAAMFFYLTALLLPKILVLVIPFAFLFAALYTFNRLKNESELVVMRAAGLSPVALAAPAVVLSAVVALVGYGLGLYVAPASYRTFKDLQSEVRTQYVSALVQEGSFNTLYRGLTIYVRGREPSGDLLGILVHDARDAKRSITMMAERGVMLHTGEGPRFVMVQGNRQERDTASGQVSMLYFDRYTLDLGRITSAAPNRWREAGERFLPELLAPGNDRDDLNNRGKFLAEAHHRLASPLTAIVFALIAAACYLTGPYDRRSDWRRVGTAIVAALVVEATSLGLTSVVSKAPSFVPLMYLNALIPSLICLYLLLERGRLRTSAGASAVR